MCNHSLTLIACPYLPWLDICKYYAVLIELRVKVKVIGILNLTSRLPARVSAGKVRREEECRVDFCLFDILSSLLLQLLI